MSLYWDESMEPRSLSAAFQRVSWNSLIGVGVISGSLLSCEDEVNQGVVRVFDFLGQLARSGLRSAE